jgi:hypothetical protein
MPAFPSSRRFVIVFGVALGIAGSVPWLRATADDAEEKVRAEDDAVAKQRLTLMQERVAACRVTSEDESIPKRFEEKPIFRYSDPARGIVSSAIWRLGTKGRPLALISTELYPKFYGRPRIVYEFLSLTDKSFNATSNDYRWQPSSSALTMKPLPKAPAPAAAATARLLQMKQQAKRFTASELAEGQECELRLMPSPIERYTPGDSDRADGALFLLSYGTNPEAVLFLESDGKEWRYGVARLSGAARMTVKLDEETAWEVGPSQLGASQNYNASNAPIFIPGIDP